MSDNGSPYITTSQPVQQLTASIAVCRADGCLVPQKHPFYPVPEKPPLYYGKRPCMPVVPTCLTTNKVMIIGEYPNCRFATVSAATAGKPQEYLPVADINEPFESGRYSDGYSIREYPTAESLHRHYLEPLGIDLRSDVWLTNINKCYLMKPGHIKSYTAVGWDTPPAHASFIDNDDYFAVAAICVARHLAHELELCQPKLIIALGEKAYRMIHSSDDLQHPALDVDFEQILGTVLLAGHRTHPLDQRNTLFQEWNVVHLYHPSYFVRGASGQTLDRHLQKHIAAVRTFMAGIGLP